MEEEDEGDKGVGSEYSREKIKQDNRQHKPIWCLRILSSKA